MKLLTVYDEIVDIPIPSGDLESNENVYTIDKVSDEIARSIAKEHFDAKSVHLKRLKQDNGYMIYTDTGLNWGGRLQSQGIFLQFDYVAGEPCNLLFFSMATDKMKNLTSVRTIPVGATTIFHEANVDILKKDNLLYDKRVVKMFEETGAKFHIADMDNGVVWKNYYLIISKVKLKDSSMLFRLYNNIKGIEGIENCSYSRPDKCVSFEHNGAKERINIIAGDIPEMNGHYYREDTITDAVMELVGKTQEDMVDAGFAIGAIGTYSKSRIMTDLMEPDLREKYMENHQENVDR